MTLVAPTVAPLAKGLSVATSHTAPKPASTPQTEAPRSSGGEVSAANLRTETARAIDAAGQSAVAPRLRDQETIERSKRLPPKLDAPTGPPPAFDESVLERRSRTALDPPETVAPAKSVPPNKDAEAEEEPPPAPVALTPETPPTPSERAEAGFAETRILSEPDQPAALDVRG